MAQSILYSVEDALYKFYSSSSLSASLTVYQGMNNADKVAPCLVCYAESAREDFKGFYVWHVRTNVIVKTMAQDMTMAAADQLSDTAYSLICDTGSFSSIAAYSSNLSIYDIMIETMDRTFEEDAWVTSATFDIISVNNS